MTLVQLQRANAGLSNGWRIDTGYTQVHRARSVVKEQSVLYKSCETQCLRLRILYVPTDDDRWQLALRGEVFTRYKGFADGEAETTLFTIPITKKVYKSREFREMRKQTQFMNTGTLQRILREYAPGYVEYIN